MDRCLVRKKVYKSLEEFTIVCIDTKHSAEVGWYGNRIMRNAWYYVIES